MPANTTPIFPLIPVTSLLGGTPSNIATAGVTANTSKDASTGTLYGPLIIGGTNGTKVEYIRVKPLGTNVATVMRVFLNNGGATTTPANNTMIFDKSLVATTTSETAEIAEFTLGAGIAIPAGYRLYATFGTAVAAGFHITTVGGDY